MAFENEIKFVLRLDDKIEKAAEDYGPLRIIEQKYLTVKDFTLRIRRTTDPFMGSATRFLTFKKNIDDQCVEIEKLLESSEAESFELLWNTCNPYTVKKHRYKYCYAKHEEWVFDFFKDKDDKTYFMQAEVEMPKNQKKPLFLPALVVDNLLFEVKIEDRRFSNKKLGDPSYASELYQSLL